jgi:hypothetical protein
MANFKLWTHPTTGEVRIYITNLYNQKSSKVFVVAKPTDSFGFEYEIRAQIPEGVYTRKSDLEDEAEKEIFAACGCRTLKFEDVKNLAK